MDLKEKSISNIINDIVEKLKINKFTIAIAESCTGGLISNTFTDISGSSTFFDRGIVSYSNDAKMQLLDVSEEYLKNYGAVSKHVAKAMADGIRVKSNVDIGLSTTGIAGPTGGTKEKPVGLVYIGLSSQDKTIVKEFFFKGNRYQNKQSTLHQVLLLIDSYLSSL